jgi:hypothetical protein
VSIGARSKRAGLLALPPSAFRALGMGIGFVVLVTAVFAGVGAWQERGSATDQPVAAPEPSPVPPPAPAPAPDPADPADDPEAPAGEGDAPVEEAPPEQPAAPAPGPRPADVSVQLLNGIGPDGSAGVTRVRSILADAGFRIVASNTGRPYDVTTIFYTVGFEAEGRLVGQALGVTAINPMTDLPSDRRLSSSVMVHVVVGADRR